jgi:phosphoglycerol transferase
MQRYTNGVREAFYNDEKFIKIIENTLPTNSMIFQMPYVSFPESPQVNQMMASDPLKAYLHSQHLRWSSGAMKGENSDLWQRRISALPIPLLVDNLVYMGFSGIYIDRHGYADNAKNIESQLTQLLNSLPIYSEDKHLIFYDLKDYTAKLKKSQLTSIWLENVVKTKQNLGR